MTMPRDARASIGTYDLLQPIGRGATGTVYLARAEGSEREVAVKVLHSGGGAEAHERFAREVAIARRLIHRHVVRLIDAGEDEEGTPYLVMELLRGQSLRELLKQAPTGIDVDTALDLVAQLCVGLHHAHEQGLVHRDVKPANVFLTQEGVIKILDFGVAKLTDTTMTADGSLVGTLAYMAPEQLTSRGELDGRADVYSAGVMLYELLTGRRPFVVDSPAAIIARLAQDAPPLPATLPEPLASLPDLEALLRKALDNDPEQRFESAQDFAHALWRVALAPRAAVLPKPVALGDTLAADQFREQVPQTVVVPQPAARAPRALLYSAVAAAAVVIIAAGVGTLLWNRSAGAAEAPAAGAPPADARPAEKPAAATPTPPIDARPAAPVAPTSAEVQIDSTPPGATIVIDGKPAGETPARVPLTLGQQVRLERANYEPASVRVDAAVVEKGALALSLTAIPRVRLRASGSYPFEILSGSRVISASSATHELLVPAGQPVRLRSSEYLLDEQIRVGRAPLEIDAPALGTLEVRSVNQTCPVFIGARDFGPLPLRVRVAAGDYTVEIRCEDGRRGRTRAVVPASGAVVARIDSVR